eukprot:943245-Ditylum_brightwellii.AAC.1
MDADKEEKYWCYASTDVIKKYNCTLHSALGNCPDFMWSGNKPSFYQLIHWCCVIYPHTHDTKALSPQHEKGYYVGITNIISLVKWLGSTANTVKHCNTAQFDEDCTHVGTDKPMSDALAIGDKPIAEKDLPILTINTSDHPYFAEPPKHFQVPLPLKGRALGLDISECNCYLLPFITKSKVRFPFHKHISSDNKTSHGFSVSTTSDLTVQKMLSSSSGHYNKRKTTSHSTYTLLREVQHQLTLALMKSDIFLSK